MLTCDFLFYTLNTVEIDIVFNLICSKLVKLRAVEPSEPLGFLVSYRYNLSYR